MYEDDNIKILKREEVLADLDGWIRFQALAEDRWREFARIAHLQLDADLVAYSASDELLTFRVDNLGIYRYHTLPLRWLWDPDWAAEAAADQAEKERKLTAIRARWGKDRVSALAEEASNLGYDLIKKEEL